MSLYEELGGGDALEAALDRFYGKVMADPPVATFFEDLDVEEIKAKQKQFWTIALGGDARYEGRDLEAAHRSARAKGLDEELFDRFIGHFQATLEEFEIPQDKIRGVLDITDAHRDEVVSPGP